MAITNDNMACYAALEMAIMCACESSPRSPASVCASVQNLLAQGRKRPILDAVGGLDKRLLGPYNRKSELAIKRPMHPIWQQAITEAHLNMSQLWNL